MESTPMPEHMPKIDNRTYSDLLDQTISIASFYTPEWKIGSEDDPGGALLNIFLHMMEDTIERLNYVPHKNFVEFLSVMGIRQGPSQSSKAAISFSLVKGLTQRHAHIPKKTLLSGQANDGSGEVIFQTEEELLASSSQLQAIYSYDASSDAIFSHTNDFINTRPYTVLKGQNLQEHSLYIGHDILFNQESPSVIKINFLLSSFLKTEKNIQFVWEYFNGNRWVNIASFPKKENLIEPNDDIPPESDQTASFTKNGNIIIHKNHKAEIASIPVNGIESRWLRCRVNQKLPSSFPITLPEVNNISISVSPKEAFLPELAFHNDIPLPVFSISAIMKVSKSPEIKIAEIKPKKNTQTLLIEHASKIFLKEDKLLFKVKDKNEPFHTKVKSVSENTITLTDKLPGNVLINTIGFQEVGLIILKYAPNVLQTNDYLKFYNYKNSTEVRKITNISFAKQESNFHRVILDKELQFEYSHSSDVSFFTALRSFDSKGSLKIETTDTLDPNNDYHVRLYSSMIEYEQVKAVIDVSKEVPMLELTGKIEKSYKTGSRVQILSSFKPFGESPQRFDSFYIASDEAFSKIGARMSLKIDSELFLPAPPSDKSEKKDYDIQLDALQPVISWEYWNGGGWRMLSANDQTLNLAYKNSEGDLNKASKKVIFTCPDDIKKIEINGEEKYWIRARLIDGDYGKRIILGNNSFFGVKTTIGYIFYPIINYIQITYENIQEPPQYCVSANSLNYVDHTEASKREDQVFKPFTPNNENFNGLFLGFDAPLTGGPLRFLFDVKEQFLKADDSIELGWSYWNGRNWQELTVRDKTEGLTRIDIISMLFRNDFQSSRLFGSSRFWLKCLFLKGSSPDPLTINGIYPNTVYSRQAALSLDEILGSGSGFADQIFKTQHPLIIDMHLWVKEPILNENEKAHLIREKGESSLIEKKNDKGEILENRILWTGVPDFDASNSLDRVYMLNHREGEIRFGDGKRGKIPPVGKDNIFGTYTHGGGKRGNVKRGAITGIKSAIPYVKEVINPLPSDGGADTESLENILIRGPFALKHRNRCVMPQDFEAFALSIRKVAKAKCLPNMDEERNVTPGWVTLLIVPDSEEKKPFPNQLLIQSVESVLTPSAESVLSVTNHIHVTGPSYAKIDVDITVTPISFDKSAVVDKAVNSFLSAYFHPLLGGGEQTGWDFGDTIFLSGIYAGIEAIEEVLAVTEIKWRIDEEPGGEQFSLDAFTLPFSGNHTVTIALNDSGVELRKRCKNQSECAASFS